MTVAQTTISVINIWWSSCSSRNRIPFSCIVLKCSIWKLFPFRPSSIHATPISTNQHSHPELPSSRERVPWHTHNMSLVRRHFIHCICSRSIHPEKQSYTYLPSQINPTSPIYFQLSNSIWEPRCMGSSEVATTITNTPSALLHSARCARECNNTRSAVKQVKMARNETRKGVLDNMLNGATKWREVRVETIKHRKKNRMQRRL